MRLRRPSLLVSLLAAAAAIAAGLPASAAAATGIAFARAPGAPFATGNPAALDVAVADFNGDHHPDLAVTLRQSGVVVLDGDGGGGFHAPRAVFTGYAQAVVTADFNGDGHPDLAISTAPTGPSSGPGVSALLGRGDGTFAPGPSLAPGSVIQAGHMAVADFNRDGHPDLAFERSAGAQFERGEVDLLLGDGHGGLAPAPGSPFSDGVNRAGGITTLDANRDGWPDVALSDDEDPGRASVLLGGSSGLSPTGPPFRIGLTPGGFPVGPAVAIRAGELNGDHKPDLVIASLGNTNDPQSGGTLSLLQGNGAGGFTPIPARGPSLGPGTGIGGLRLADFDGDGHLDAAVMSGRGAQPLLRVLTGDGRGNLTLLATAFPVPVEPFHDVAVADVNGDGRPDVVTPGFNTGTVDVLLNLAPSLQVRAVSLESVVRSGLPVTVGCSAACTLETDLLLGASAARHRAPVVLGRATTRLRARGRKRIRVHLSSRGRTLLRRVRRASLTVRTSALTRGRPKGRPATRTLVLHR